ncbi:hypothetical protein H6798_01650 [Candidatus Nomurabacteria bacterium]|nr:hypothetical protein [Candidatus Nomurabacteria bacterium]
MGGTTSAVAGDIGSTLPNNGSSLPWLVVTRPGGNGMDASKSKVIAYVPASLTSFSMNIIDACDQTLNDKNGGLADTYFDFIPNASISASPGTILNIGGRDVVRCDSGVSITPVTVNIDSSAPTVTIHTPSTTDYKLVTVLAKTSTTSTGIYYVNRFRYQTVTPGVLFGYSQFTGALNENTNISALTPAQHVALAANFTAISYDQTSSRTWGWNTKIAFAQPCSTSSVERKKIFFYDTDHNPSGSTLNPYWQTALAGQTMSYKIDAYARDTRTFIGTVKTGTLTGGNNFVDASSPDLNMDPNQFYVIEVQNVNLVNSIQIAIPYDQIYAYDQCSGPAPTVTVTRATCANGFQFTVTDRNGYNFTAELQVDNASLSPARTIPGINSDATRTFDVSDWQDFTGHNFRIAVTNDSYPGVSVTTANTRVGPCLELACGDASTTPSPVEVGKTFAVNTSYDIHITGTTTPARVGSKGTSVKVAPTVSFGGLGGFTEPTVLLNDPGYKRTIDSTSGTNFTINNIGDYTAPTTPGEFTINYGLAGDLTLSCNDSSGNRIAQLPYFKVYEADVVTGAAFGLGNTSNACDAGYIRRTSSLGKALGFARLDTVTGYYSGASVEFALRAQDAVNGVVSNLNNATNAKSLTFANTLPASPTWGGSFGSSTCVANYWYPASLQTSWSNVNNYTLNSGVGRSDAAYIRPASGTLTLRGSGNIRNRHALYVDGNLLITDGGGGAQINYGGYDWQTVDDIPTIYIYVRGNIYIAPGVTSIDAVLIALPVDTSSPADNLADSGGKIYTCSTGGLANPATHYARCNNQLVINGALVADEVHFGRTNGSTSLSAYNEGPTSPNIAEVIYMSPEYYLATPPQPAVSSSLYQTDSAQTLPPTL